MSEDVHLKDRRLVHVSLTEQGKALARNAPSPLQDAFAGAMRKLPETELVMIAESLERIVGLMQMQHVDAAPILETGPSDAVLRYTGALRGYEEHDKEETFELRSSKPSEGLF